MKGSQHVSCWLGEQSLVPKTRSTRAVESVESNVQRYRTYPTPNMQLWLGRLFVTFQKQYEFPFANIFLSLDTRSAEYTGPAVWWFTLIVCLFYSILFFCSVYCIGYLILCIQTICFQLRLECSPDTFWCFITKNCIALPHSAKKKKYTIDLCFKGGPLWTNLLY